MDISKTTPCLDSILEQINLILEFEDFEFREKLSDDEKLGTIKYSGRNVDWYGDPDSMIVIHKDDVFSRVDNNFYPKKLDQIEELIRNSEENVEILCSYGMGEIVTISDIMEQQTSFYNDRFYNDYSLENPRSIGDSDLDRYLGDVDYTMDEINFDDEELNDYLEENLYQLDGDVEEMRRVFKKMTNRLSEDHPENDSEWYEDGELAEEWYNHADEQVFSRIEAIQNAIESKDGDLGKFVVQIRDSNHRITGAVNSGEEYVCIELYSLSKDPKKAKTLEGKYQLVRDL